jgi:hypothetical protein
MAHRGLGRRTAWLNGLSASLSLTWRRLAQGAVPCRGQCNLGVCDVSREPFRIRRRVRSHLASPNLGREASSLQSSDNGVDAVGLSLSWFSSLQEMPMSARTGSHGAAEGAAYSTVTDLARLRG